MNLALQEYEGGVVLVSHDRHLLRTTADELWLVADGQVRIFDGDLDDYSDWLASQRSAASAPSAGKSAEKQARREDKAQLEAARQAKLVERRSLQKDAAKMEKQITNWQAELSLLEARLADPALYSSADSALLQTLQKQKQNLVRRMNETEERWLAIQEEIESAPATAS